jgi:hypothetical protein
MPTASASAVCALHNPAARDGAGCGVWRASICNAASRDVPQGTPAGRSLPPGPLVPEPAAPSVGRCAQHAQQGSASSEATSEMQTEQSVKQQAPVKSSCATGVRNWGAQQGPSAQQGPDNTSGTLGGPALRNDCQAVSARAGFPLRPVHAKGCPVSSPPDQAPSTLRRAVVPWNLDLPRKVVDGIGRWFRSLPRTVSPASQAPGGHLGETASDSVPEAQTESPFTSESPSD